MNAKGQQITAAAQATRYTLRNKVPMPGTSTDQGNVGDYAQDDGTMAVYFEDKGDGNPGWLFFDGYQR